VSYWLGVAFFVVALLTSVMVHEAGHFLTARAFGMKATQFFVGFGPTLFSRRRGETEYGVKALPLGGFVKIVGMTPFEEVAPGDERRAFYRKPLRQRVIVLVAGSTTHFVVAVLLILAVAFFPARPDAGLLVRSTAACVPVSDVAMRPSTGPDGSCPPGSVAAPAAFALRTGDVLLGIDGHRFTREEDPTTLLRTASSADAALLVRRDGAELTVPVQLAAVQRNRAQGGRGTEQAFALGVTSDVAGYSHPTWSEGWSAARTLLGTSPQGLIGSIPAAVTKIPDRFTHLFAPGSLDGPQSAVGIAQLSGGIAASDAPLSTRVATLVGIVASVNFFVGVLNLLPLLPFDGGHIAVNIVDRLRNGRRRRRRQERGSIAEVYARFAPVSYAVFAVIAVGSLLVLTSNIVNPLRL